MNPDWLEALQSRMRARRGNMHVRAAAFEIGISPTTTLVKIKKGGFFEDDPSQAHAMAWRI